MVPTWVQVLWRWGRDEKLPEPKVVPRDEYNRYLEENDREMKAINEIVAAIRQEQTQEGGDVQH